MLEHIQECGFVIVRESDVTTLRELLAQAANDYCVSQLTVIKIKAMNPGVKLRLPRYETVVRTSQTRLYTILVRPRRTERRGFRFCPSRRRWTSLTHIPGGPTLLQSVHDG